MPTLPLLQADDIGRTDADGRWLIRHVSVAISAGERWAVTGPTGSGKTVFLRALAMLDPIDEGRITWKGNLIIDEEIPQFRRDVVYLHQRPALLTGTVEQNLQLPFRLAQADNAEFNRDAAVSLLDQLGRDADFLQKSSEDLSGGESQIVALLRAMQVNPSILLLDEPTSALDADATLAVENLISQWLKESPTTRATLWVTHDTEQLPRIADRVLKLENQADGETRHD